MNDTKKLKPEEYSEARKQAIIEMAAKGIDITRYMQ